MLRFCYKLQIITCYFCLRCNHRSKWTWVVEEMLPFGKWLRSMHCRKFLLHAMQTLRFLLQVPKIGTKQVFVAINPGPAPTGVIQGATR